MINASTITCWPGTELFSHCYSPEVITSITPQLNYMVDTILELKVEFAKIKIELKVIKNQLIVVPLFLINKVRHSQKVSPSISAAFQHKYHFQNPKNKISFS